MGVLIQILATYAPYIYLVCGLVALYQLYRLTQVRATGARPSFPSSVSGQSAACTVSSRLR